jgi:acyl dehydratase
MVKMSLCFEDFAIGQTYTTRGRTITEADIVNFAGISGDFHPLHMDAQYAGGTLFGRRIAHGLLSLTVVSGLSQELGHLKGSITAFVGLNWQFKKPVFIGDTIYEEQIIADKRETGKGNGVVTIHCRVINQQGEVIQEGDRIVMVARRKVRETGYCVRSDDDA